MQRCPHHIIPTACRITQPRRTPCIWYRNAVLLFTLLLSSFIGLPFSHGQTATIRGFVTDRSDGEALLGVNVVLEDDDGTFLGAVTDGDGVYNISRIDAGRYYFRVSYVGYRTHLDTLNIRANETQIINVALVEEETELDEVVVETERESGIANVTAGLQSVTPGDIDLIPSPDVTGDLVSYLSVLPGIITLGDRGGQLFVRGGEPSHNMFFLDGMYVHQPFHLLGFYSAFPSEILSRVDVYAAGYESRFSGRVSSVIDIYTRNGNIRRFNGSVSMAPFVSSITFEGPLSRDKFSILVSYRKSVIEQLAQHYVDQQMPYDFGDFFGKIYYAGSDNHRLSFSFLDTHDRGTIGERSEDRVLDEIRYTNRAFGVRYLVLPRRIPFIAEILLSSSKLRSELGPVDHPIRFSNLKTFSYAVNITNFIGTAEWHWGLFWRAPEISSYLGGIFQNIEFGFGRRHKAGLHIEPDVYLTEKLHLRAGIVAQVFPGQDDDSFVEPRMRIVWRSGRHQVSGAAGVYHQEIVGLNDRRDATSVFTAWRSAPTTYLSKSTHTLVGYRYTPLPWLEMSVEAYHKQISNLYIGEWTSFPRFTTRLQRASGLINGLDLRLEVSRPKFYGYINYGLSSVTYEAKQASLQLWYGEESLRFRPPHDRRHQVNIVASTSVAGFDISARWNFGSGRPFSRVFGFDGFVLMNGTQDLFNVWDEQRVIYERPYRGILPTYHRLDVSIERIFEFDSFAVTVQAGAINLYDRRNLFALDIFTMRRTDQLPFIPTMGLKLAFN